jgi:hypothetical protein
VGKLLTDEADPQELLLRIISAVADKAGFYCFHLHAVFSLSVLLI